MQNKALLAVIGLIVAVAVGYGIASRRGNKSDVASDTEQGQMMKKEGTDAMEKEGEAMKKDEAMMNKDEGAMMEKKDGAMMTDDKMAGDAMMAKQGSYVDYSAETVAAEQKAGHKVVLSFYAPWCPFCKAADAAFKAKLDQIPAGVTVVKTDYDSNTALKQKYGVTYQHTFVQIDASGNQVSKWSGGDIENLKIYLK